MRRERAIGLCIKKQINNIVGRGEGGGGCGRPRGCKHIISVSAL